MYLGTNASYIRAPPSNVGGSEMLAALRLPKQARETTKKLMNAQDFLQVPPLTVTSLVRENLCYHSSDVNEMDTIKRLS